MNHGTYWCPKPSVESVTLYQRCPRTVNLVTACVMSVKYGIRDRAAAPKLWFCSDHWRLASVLWPYHGIGDSIELCPKCGIGDSLCVVPRQWDQRECQFYLQTGGLVTGGLVTYHCCLQTVESLAVSKECPHTVRITTVSVLSPNCGIGDSISAVHQLWDWWQ